MGAVVTTPGEPEHQHEPESDQEEQQPGLLDLLRMVHWLNLLNPRMWLVSAGVAIGISIPFGLLWEPLVGVVVPVAFFGMLLATSLQPGHCPDCGKAIKVGYTRCRACGQDVAGK